MDSMVGLLINLFALAVVIFSFAMMWITVEKAGYPGWSQIIPFYNVYILLQVAGKPAWWLILFFVPIVNLIMAILMGIGIANNFGKGTGF